MRFLVLFLLAVVAMASTRIRSLRSKQGVRVNFNNGACSGETYHNWMHTLAAKNSATWANQPLTNIIVPASHDAGCIVGGMANTVTGVNPNLYETQDLTVGQQLCQGYRMFDLRFKMYNNEWRIFHGDVGTGYFTRATDVINDIKLFVTNHPGEIVFFRMKVAGGSSQEKVTLFSHIEQELRDSLVPDTANLPTLTVAQVVGAPHLPGYSGANVGRVVLLDMCKKDGSKLTAGFPLEHYAFNSKTTLLGKFSSDARLPVAPASLALDAIKPLTTKQVLSKQVSTLDTFKADKSKYRKIMYGWWYTRTGGVIRNTTPVLFRDYSPYAHAYNVGQTKDSFLGNAFWVDFAGVPSEHGRTVGNDDPVVDFVVDLNHVYCGLIGTNRYASVSRDPWGANYQRLL